MVWSRDFGQELKRIRTRGRLGTSVGVPLTAMAHEPERGDFGCRIAV
jgi:hypothetical protein